MNIQELVYKMLTESTGAALMDSGDAYGRHWEHNQKKTLQDFINEPEVEVTDFEEGTFSISTFHYLTTRLELDSICNEFNTLFEEMDDWDGIGYGVSEEATKWLRDNGFTWRMAGDSKTRKFTVDDPYTFNTYNDPDNQHTDQVLQGTFIHRDSDTYVLLQIHNGCDVRGGYTDAKMFYLPGGGMPTEDASGTIDGVFVDSLYNNWQLTDDQGEPVKMTEDSKVELYLVDY